jgi:hypothetical protein
MKKKENKILTVLFLIGPSFDSASAVNIAGCGKKKPCDEVKHY